MRADAIISLVRRLLTQESAESQDQASLAEAAERVSDKLRVHLSKRIGAEGFRTLLARAVILTIAQFPHLSGVRVGTNGSLVGLRGAVVRGLPETRGSGAPDDATVEGTVALIAQIIGLLITFIGEDITLRMLSAVWPGLALGDAANRENERP